MFGNPASNVSARITFSAPHFELSQYLTCYIEAQIFPNAHHHPFEDTNYNPYENNAHVDVPSPLKQHIIMPSLMRVRSLTRDAAEVSVDPEAWLYARVAFLFFITLLTTWDSSRRSK